METTVRFNSKLHTLFSKTLKSRVDDYFSAKKINPHYNPGMLIKTGVMLSLYLIPFVLILSNMMPVWENMFMYLIMGVGISGIGMSVMHDGNHYAYAKSPRLNRIMGQTMRLLGADAYNWKIKHNKLHHVFTNIYGKDEDINSRAVLRFAYASPLKPYHRYQHVYAWFLYSLMTLSMIFGDISKRKDYRKRGLTHLQKSTFRRSVLWLVVSKILYTTAIFLLPLILTDMLWWQVMAGFLIMHLTAGTILSLIFQMAHVVEGPVQPMPDAGGRIDNSLIGHQLATTADFSKSNRLLSWFVGGLNFQVEHHLFPRVCHVHYRALSKIVETTTREFGMPYYVYDSFADAFRSHYRTLKKLGSIKYPTFPTSPALQ